MRVFRFTIYPLILMLALTCPTAFAGHDIKQFQDIVWAKPKGFGLTLDIAVPQTSSKSKPVLVIFHGGGWLLNDKSIMTDLANGIAARTDIITVNANYRLLSDLDNTTAVNEIVEDAMGAVLWVKQHIHTYGGDPNRLAVTGDSAGGHLAAMVTLAGRALDSDGFDQPPLKFKPTYLPENVTAEQVAEQDGLKVQAAILSYTGFSLVSMAERGFETDSNRAWEWANVEPRGLFGGKINVGDNPEHYRALSPEHYLEKNQDYPLARQFVHVGERDRVTTPTSAQRYVRTLKALKQPVEFKIYRGKGHGFLDSGCNQYNNGCFEALAEPAISDMVTFLNRVFRLPAHSRLP